MGMAFVHAPYRVIPSATYKGCFYCQACRATYKPNLVWGYVDTPRDSTNPADDCWYGMHRLGSECPMCGRKPETE